MIRIHSIIILLIISFVLINTQKICKKCYSQLNGQIEFTCHLQNCDKFYWPRDYPLPPNLQCNPAQPNSTCFILFEIDPTNQLYTFMSLQYLQQQQQQKSKSKQISFTFQQQSNSSMIINANVYNTKYQTKLANHPQISFDDVKQVLANNQFKKIQKTADVLKLKIGFYTLEMKNTLIISISQLQNTINQLTKKVNEQSTKNTDKLNDQLRNQINRYNKRINDIQSFVTKNKNDMDGQNRQVIQANSKIQQVEKVNNQLRGKITTLERKLAAMEQVLVQGNKEKTVVSSKIIAIQQRVSTNDQTINQLRQMFGMVDRKFSDFSKAFKNQKTLINKLNSKLATVTQGIQIDDEQLELEPFVIPDIAVTNSPSVDDNLTSSQTTNSSIQKNDRKLFIIPEYSLEQVLNKSRVITSKQQIDAIEKFFQPRKISKLQLLYRASQNQFSAAVFHKKCDKIADTLVVFENEFGKKIGGFTPLLWDGTKNGQYKADQTGQSFTFSLSNKHKFTLQQKNKAIWNHVNYGPIFGSGADFSIYDQAHLKPSSYSDISRSYHHPNYKQRNRDSWERFCGNLNNSWHFRIKEWEVWRVEFQLGQGGQL